MTDSKRVHTLVIDSGPIIRNEPSSSSILAQAESLFTIPAVVSEIRDESTRTRFETLLKPFVTLRQPSPSSIKFVTDFARRTGDLDVLSKPDILIIALTYELECERNGGDGRLRKVPGQKALNGASLNRTSDPSQGETSEDAVPTVNSGTAPASPTGGDERIDDSTVQAPSGDAVLATEPQNEDDPATPEVPTSEAVGGNAQKSRSNRPRRRTPGRTQMTQPQADQAVELDSEWTTIPSRKPVQFRNTASPKATRPDSNPNRSRPVTATADDTKETTSSQVPVREEQAALSEPASNDPLEAQSHEDAVAGTEGAQTSPLPKVDSAQESEPGEDASDSDPDSWITPQNLDSKQAKDAGGAVQEDRTEQQMEVAVITTDFAMQNVILQMNLKLLSSSLQRVRHVRSTAMRCQACFLVSKQMDKQFCTRCGKPTLTRVSCSTTADGEFKIHLRKNFQYNSRGDRYSIPKPVHGSANGRIKGGGKGGWGSELILAEDQKEYERHSQVEKRAKERNLMDEDYLPSILTGDRSKTGGRIKVGAGRNVNAKKRS